jgi:single-stranded-DNA-specific exonuclease
MAAGFTIKKNNMKILDDFIQNDYIKKNPVSKIFYKYDAEISPSIVNMNFMNQLNKLGPFGNYNALPVFLIKNVKIIKSNLIENKHISSIIKPNVGSSIQSICFNCVDTQIGEYLLSYKKQINIIGQINENIWNNKKTIQLDIRDLILKFN